MASTNISWSDAVWNPVVGCSRVSAGCERCYAETFAHRLDGMGQARYRGLTVIGKQGARWTGEVRQVPEVLGAPLRWRKGKRIFVNSMSDLFHEKVPFEYVAAVFGVMAACPQHTFQVLTKRPERALEYFRWVEKRGEDGLRLFPDDPQDWRIRQLLHVEARRRGVDLSAARHQNHGGPWPLPNVYLGVSVENQPRADERIPLLLECPAAVRWISAEPLLAPVSLRIPWGGIRTDVLRGWKSPADGLRWVVVGGESGADRRECDPAWIDSIVADCVAAHVPVFVKQDSGLRPGSQGRLSAATWARKEFPEVRA